MNHTADTAHGQGTHGVEGAQMVEGAVNIPPGEGKRTSWVLGELVTYKVSSQRTGGAFALFEVATPAGAAAPPHVQHREDEFFFVIEGEYEFQIEGRTLRVRTGSLLYVPKGTLHRHKNVGKVVGRMLVTQTPGGLYEHFFEEVGTFTGAEDGSFAFEDQPEEVGRILEIAAEYGIEIPLSIMKRSRV